MGLGTVAAACADEIDELQVLDMEYEVEWLQPGEDEIEGVREVLARGQIGRKRSPLTRLLLKSWLQEAATCEAIEVNDVALVAPVLSPSSRTSVAVLMGDAVPRKTIKMVSPDLTSCQGCALRAADIANANPELQSEYLYLPSSVLQAVQKPDSARLKHTSLRFCWGEALASTRMVDDSLKI